MRIRDDETLYGARSRSMGLAGVDKDLRSRGAVEGVGGGAGPAGRKEGATRDPVYRDLDATRRVTPPGAE